MLVFTVKMQPSQAGSNALLIAKCTYYSCGQHSVPLLATGQKKILATDSAENSTLDTHVTLWVLNGDVDMQLCVKARSLVQCVAQCSVSNVHWWHDVQQCDSVAQCIGPAVYSAHCKHTGVHAVHWRGSSPVSWWRRPAVRGRLQ